MTKDYSTLKTLVTTYITAIESFGKDTTGLVDEIRAKGLPEPAQLERLLEAFGSVRQQLSDLSEQIAGQGIDLATVETVSPESIGHVATETELAEALERLLPDVPAFLQRARLIAAKAPQGDVPEADANLVYQKLVKALAALATLDQLVKTWLGQDIPTPFERVGWEPFTQAMKELGRR